MNFTAWLWSEGSGFHNVIRFPFTLLSWIYGSVIRFRLLLYALGILPKKRVDCRVISIGNITVGGTGKTPMTIYLAEQWRKRGAAVGIVSRGYGRKKKDPVIVVSDGVNLHETAEAVGDEPVLMAKCLCDIPIVVAADRHRGCQLLLNDFKVDLILLDDGFQHIRMYRDFNILLIDAENPFGNKHLLPRGFLREPVSEIGRADCIVITRADLSGNLSLLSTQLDYFGLPVLKSRFQSNALLDLSTGILHPLDMIKNRPILAFCGIGNPTAFFKQLVDLGAELRKTKVFQDHHHYEVADLLSLIKHAGKIGINWVVTTEKDAVKIKALKGADFGASPACQFFALRIGVTFLNPLEEENILFSQ